MKQRIDQKFERKGYLREIGKSEASKTLKRNLEMIDVGKNVGKAEKGNNGTH